MPFLTLSAKLWGLLAAIVGMILDVVQFWNHVCYAAGNHLLIICFLFYVILMALYQRDG